MSGKQHSFFFIFMYHIFPYICFSNLFSRGIYLKINQFVLSDYKKQPKNLPIFRTYLLRVFLFIIIIYAYLKGN